MICTLIEKKEEKLNNKINILTRSNVLLRFSWCFFFFFVVVVFFFFLTMRREEFKYFLNYILILLFFTSPRLFIIDSQCIKRVISQFCRLFHSDEEAKRETVMTRATITTVYFHPEHVQKGKCFYDTIHIMGRRSRRRKRRKKRLWYGEVSFSLLI